MASEKESGGRSALEITVRLRDVRPDDQRPEIEAYAFSTHGRLLDRRPVKDDGPIALDLSKNDANRTATLVVGPSSEDEPTLAELRRLGATEREVRYDDIRLPIPFEIWRPEWILWWRRVCCVRGRVVKRIEGVDLPVCNATVEVFEVDPFRIWIEKLPDSFLDRLKDIIAETQPIPFPTPWPDPRELKIPRLKAVAVSSDFLELFGGYPNPEDPDEPDGPGGPVMQNVLEALRNLVKIVPEKLKVVARSGSLSSFRQEALLYPELFRPILCWLRPRWVTRQKIAEGVTQCDGRFRICFYHSWFNPDTPDLWFRVTQHVPGHGTVVIYQRFPVACHTWWNYSCGSEVTLRTTHPLAYTCACDPNVDNPGNWVLMDAIGATFAAQIRGMSASLEATTTPANRGLTGDGRPFAGRLDPILYFSPSLTAAGVRYRISYRKEGAATWTPLNSAISRSYLYDDGGMPVWGTYSLGPTDGLYACRPLNPPQGSWEVRYYRNDRAATYFDTWDLPALDFGLYHLKFEIFRADGTPLALTDPALGFSWLLGTGTPGMQDPASPALLDGNALVVPVRVDKRMCVANIGSPSLGGMSADPECGGLTFTGTGGTVQMPYVATHPGGFFTYSWNLVRGAGNAVPGIIYSPGLAQASVANMIDTCTDGAAFAITLNVYGTAQDGYSRLGNFDDGDTLAFMLIKA